MGSLLSGISGYFSKNLILGTFLPVVVFVSLGLLLAMPLFPLDWTVLKPLQDLDTQWKAIAISFLTIVITGLLYGVNIPLIRLYEGYPWRQLVIGRWRTNKYKRLFRIALSEWKGTPHIEYAWRERRDQLSRFTEQKDFAGRTLFLDFPAREDLVLPTRLGNVIRSFESYPFRQYHMEAITFWPRLVAKVDKEYAAGIEETKTSFDFMLNCSALSTLLSFIIFVIGSLYPAHLNKNNGAIIWVVEIVSFMMIAYISYSLSIDRARAWGNTIRTAFDLYRLDLLKQLGYTGVPASLAEERELWEYIGERMIYGDYYLLPPAEYTPRTSFASCTPKYARLEIARGIACREPTPAEATPSSGEMMIKISVRNVGIYGISEAFVTDTLPDGFGYRWDSASATDDRGLKRRVSISGTNPYRFGVGALKKNEGLVLEYSALSFKDLSPSSPIQNESESGLTVFSGDLLAYKASAKTAPASVVDRASSGTASQPKAEDNQTLDAKGKNHD